MSSQIVSQSQQIFCHELLHTSEMNFSQGLQAVGVEWGEVVEFAL